MGAKYLGASVKRREDPALLAGHGRFLDDLRLPGLLHAGFVRSPHPHARILGVHTTEARQLAGVVAVFTFEDLGRWVKPLPPLTTPPSGLTDRVDVRVTDVRQYPLARDRVRYVGEIVAVVIGTDPYVVEDAAHLVTVEYQGLPVVPNARAGVTPNAPAIHPELGSNIAVRVTGVVGDVEAAFRGSEIVVRESFRVPRLAGMPLEPRGVVASYEQRDNTVTTWNSTQLPHFVQQEIAAALELPLHKVRVITPDVGGGFGTKACAYAEDVLIPLVARELNRPIKWTEGRHEHVTAAAHSRDQLQDIEIGASREGVIRGLRGHVLLDLGSYNPGGFILAYNTLAHLVGPYRVPALSVTFTGVLTNRTPVAPYRGAGRPEAVFAMERSLDLLARRLAIDPAEIRLRNMVRPEAMPYDTGLVYRDGHPVIYDSGDFPAMIGKALELAGYRAFRAEQGQLRQRGIYRGIGMAAYVEGTALGPYESASVKLDRSGRAVIATGACSQGQGHETVFAQIAADVLGMPLDWVTVIGGDTDRVTFGIGTFVSRSAVMAGNAVAEASARVRRMILESAAKLLEASPEDLTLESGHVWVRGTPTSAVPLARVVQAGLPTYVAAGAPPFEATVYQHVPTVTYASGAHVAEVEVDADTGRVTLRRYVAAHDCGRVINPMIVEGQIHGGVAQGVGGGLFEEIVYDDDGQLLTGTLMDYAVPTASDLPAIETVHLEFASPRNPLGLKGAGEAGAIAPPAAIANAVEDALAALGVRITATPITSNQVSGWLRNETQPKWAG
jgi:carbon-monoxide dehydrogenase large subunit